MMPFIMDQKDVQHCFPGEMFLGRILWSTRGDNNGRLLKSHNANSVIKTVSVILFVAILISKCRHYSNIFLNS